MLWCSQATSFFLNKHQSRFFTPHKVTRSPWVNHLRHEISLISVNDIEGSHESMTYLFCPQVSVSVVPSVPSCTSVSVEPLSVDDWEILVRLGEQEDWYFASNMVINIFTNSLWQHVRNHVHHQHQPITTFWLVFNNNCILHGACQGCVTLQNVLNLLGYTYFWMLVSIRILFWVRHFNILYQ